MANISKSAKFALVGLGAGALSLLVHNFSSHSSMESWYGNGLFGVMRVLLDNTFGLLPVSGTLVLVIALLYLIIRALRQIKDFKWKSSALHLIGGLGMILFTFYMLWGFNYSRAPVGERVSWEDEPISADELFLFADQHLAKLNQMRMELDSVIDFDHNQSVKEVRQAAYALATDLGYKVPGRRLRLREWSDIGFLLRIGTAGFYNPFTGECNIDGGLHALQKPYVIAHEFFHGMGVTDEGDCNFLAYLLCQDAADKYVRYSGELALWRYLRSALHLTDQERFHELAAKSSPLIIADLMAIREQMLKYPDIAPRARDRIYHAYLRSNKVDDGMASYGNVVGMTIMWDKNGNSIP